MRHSRPLLILSLFSFFFPWTSFLFAVLCWQTITIATATRSGGLSEVSDAGCRRPDVVWVRVRVRLWDGRTKREREKDSRR